MKPKFIATRFHSYLAWELQKFYERVRDDHDERIMAEVQPQIGKSTLFSELFPAWILGKEGWPVIVASYGASLAEQKSGNCRDLVDSEVYKMIFPKTKIHPDTSAKEYWKTTTGGSYRAVGVGGGLTGMSGKIIIADDLFKDRQDAESETVREGTWRWWQSVLMTRRQSKSGVGLVNTRWHLDDISGKLLEQQEDAEVAKKPAGTFDVWKRLRFPAFAEEDEYVDGVLFRKEGEVLCPERFTMEDMIKTRNQMENYEWSALYMQSPILSENAEFQQGWFKYYEQNDVPRDVVWTTTVDLAISQKTTADRSVVRTVGKSPRFPQWYLGEETAGRLDPLQVIDAMFMHWKKYRSRVWIESVAYQKALSYFVLEEMRKRQEYFDINELKRSSTTSKETRIRGLIPLYKAGVMLHRKGLDTELEREELQFPKGRHDDRVDCLAMQLEVVSHTRIPDIGENDEKAFDKFRGIGTI